MKYALTPRWNIQESHSDTATIALWYPRLEDCCKYIEVELSDVRAADSIRVSYDFDRDGWKIEQAAVHSWDGDDEVCDPKWTEVAFLGAWALERPDDSATEGTK